MKLIVIAFVLGLNFSTAHAGSCTEEAQFSGEVTHIVAEDSGCWAYLNMSSYNPSQVCPLEQQIVDYYGVYAYGENCPYELGQKLSGVLIRDLEDVILEL